MVAIGALFKPDPTAQTQYRGVYRRPDRPGLYAARFKEHGRFRLLGYFPSETDAARRVAEEYAAVFGPGWESLFRGGGDGRRRRWWAVRPWHEVRKRPGRRAIRRRVGYVVSVWEWGRETQLGDHLHPTDRRRDSARRRPWVFKTWSEAWAATTEWGRTAGAARWGLLAGIALWRA